MHPRIGRGVMYAALKSTLNASQFLTICVIRIKEKDKLPLLTSSTIFHQFECICNVAYMGRTVKYLFKHMKALANERRMAVRSFTKAHLETTRCDEQARFRACTKVHSDNRCHFYW